MTAAASGAVSAEVREACALQEKESRQQCEAAVKARREMAPEEARQLDALAESLRPHFLCNYCHNLLLEPWLVKDCGHLYCFQCLQSMVYDRKANGCVAAGCVGGKSTWTVDSFGAFKLTADADGNRRIGRDGSKFLLDDAADTLIRMLWPERVEDYVVCDIEKERRRLEDLAAREHYTKSIQPARLATPSGANANVAVPRAQRVQPAAGAVHRRPTRRLKEPTMKLHCPHASVLPPPAFGASGGGCPAARSQLVFLAPIQCTQSSEMKLWAEQEGLMHTFLPPLLKPYLQLPSEQITVQGLKDVLVAALNDQSLWHDHSRPYDVALSLSADDVVLLLDWTLCPRSPVDDVFLVEVPTDSVVQEAVAPRSVTNSVEALIQYLLECQVDIDPSLDLLYCLRP